MQPESGSARGGLSRGVADIEKVTMRRVSMRIIPFLMLCYFIAYVDRVNAGFAALQMNKDIGLSQAAFGIGGSLFFIAYIIFEIPSNLAMEKVGARLWIARIMISWGIVGAAAAFATGPYTYYLGRFLLGAAEAGFFPGVILYLTFWFPASYRARIVATFMVAIPISSLLGSPISGALLGTDGWLGLRGWQWLFIFEALPAILLGIFCLFFLPGRPTDELKWLSGDQRQWLVGQLEMERGSRKPVGHASLWKVLSNKYVLILALVYAGSSATSNALSLWQPQILKSFGLSNMQIGWLNGIPFALASIGMIYWGRRADKTGERVWNTALPLALTSAALIATNFTSSLTVTLILLCVVLLGNYAIKGPFWALATDWLSTGTAAAGIAAINTLSHIGTGGATALLGVIKEQTGSFSLALLPLAALTAAGSVAIVLTSRGQTRGMATAGAAD